MKPTIEVLAGFDYGDKFAVFINGEIASVYTIVGGDYGKAISLNGYKVDVSYWLDRLDGSKTIDIFPASEIKMPCSKTADISEALSGIEIKAKTCQQWFDELGEGTLKDAITARWDEHFANQHKAIDIFDAIECGCTFDEDENSLYLKRVIEQHNNTTIKYQ